MNVSTRSKPLAYCQITGLNVKKSLVADSGLSPPIPLGARYALLQAESKSIRWRDDTTDPTATVGMRLIADGEPFLYDGDLSAIEFIEESASAKLNVAFYA